MKRFVAMWCCAVALVSFSGCNNKPAADKDKPAAKEGHSHGEGPHGGALFDWGGGKYHVEFTVDHTTKTATIYIIGGDAKTAVPVKATKVKLVINDPKSEIELTASPEAGETDGKSSRYVGTHDTLGIVKEYAGTVTGEIEGTPYTGDFKEEPHVEPKK